MRHFIVYSQQSFCARKIDNDEILKAKERIRNEKAVVWLADSSSKFISNNRSVYKS